jgi:hypothetical protein
MFRVIAGLVLLALLLVDCATPASARFISSVTAARGAHASYGFRAPHAYLVSPPFPDYRCTGHLHELIIAASQLVKDREGSSPGWCGLVSWTTLSPVGRRGQAPPVNASMLFKFNYRTNPAIDHTRIENYHFCSTANCP